MEKHTNFAYQNGQNVVCISNDNTLILSSKIKEKIDTNVIIVMNSKKRIFKDELLTIKALSVVYSNNSFLILCLDSSLIYMYHREACIDLGYSNHKLQNVIGIYSGDSYFLIVLENEIFRMATYNNWKMPDVIHNSKLLKCLNCNYAISKNDILEFYGSNNYTQCNIPIIESNIVLDVCFDMTCSYICYCDRVEWYGENNYIGLMKLIVNPVSMQHHNNSYVCMLSTGEWVFWGNNYRNKYGFSNFIESDKTYQTISEYYANEAVESVGFTDDMLYTYSACKITILGEYSIWNSKVVKDTQKLILTKHNLLCITSDNYIHNISEIPFDLTALNLQLLFYNKGSYI